MNLELKVYHLTNGLHEAMVEAFSESMAKGRFTAELSIPPTLSELSKIRAIGVYEKDSARLKEVILKKNLPLFRENNPEKMRQIQEFLDDLRIPERNCKECDENCKDCIPDDLPEFMRRRLLSLKILDSILDDIIEAGNQTAEESSEEKEEKQESEKAMTNKEQLDKLMKKQNQLCTEIMSLKEELSDVERQIKELLDR